MEALFDGEENGVIFQTSLVISTSELFSKTQSRRETDLWQGIHFGSICESLH